MSARAAAIFVALLFVAGCTSTVVLGTLGSDGGGPSVDLARPIFDGFDGFVDLAGDGFDGGGSQIDLATDGGLVIDLAP